MGSGMHGEKFIIRIVQNFVNKTKVQGVLDDLRQPAKAYSVAQLQEKRKDPSFLQWM